MSQLAGTVGRAIWILTITLSFLFFPQFSRYTFAQTQPVIQAQQSLNEQILDNRFSLSEEERTRIATTINGIIATLNPDTKLPTSHLDDRSLTNWLLTYDAAAVAMEFKISGKQKEAEQILDYFVSEYNRSLEEMHIIDKDTTVFVSDPLTSLRAQEGCAYIKMLKNKGLLESKDSSLVAYSASYKDARVGKIAYIINEWRDETYPLVYALKNRASFASLTKTISLEAELLESYLYRFKQLDFDLLKQLLQLMETMDEFNIDKDKVENLLNTFRQERMEIINSLLEEINQRRITDKEGTLQKEARMIINKYRSKFDFIKAFKISVTAFLSIVLALFSSRPVKAENYHFQITKFENWLLLNRDNSTGLPHSHVGDDRFENWAITYDSAIVILAYIALGRINDAKRIVDFYIQTPNVWRLGGIIEAVNPTNPVLGEDWSVRTGSNLWMGIASFHLYKVTGEIKYLDLAKRLADFALSLQNNNEKDHNFRGIRLGPQGGGNVAGDQHLGYDQDQPSFYEVFATEHNIDAYALFNMLYSETNDTKYKNAKETVLLWLKNVGYNKEEHRFNRGYKRGLDPVIATDIHSWGISALGVDVLDTFEPGLAEKMIEFIEKNCLSKVSFTKPNGKKVKVKGADFIDYKTAASLGRKPLVSPEWTFQLINAYRKLELDFKQQGNIRREIKYRKKRQELIKNMLTFAIESQDTLSYPYATQAEAVIGHEYNTPKEGNLSTIGVSYAILALKGFEPLIYPFKQDTKQIALNSFTFLPLLIGSSIFIQSEPFTNWIVGCLTVIIGAIFMFKNQISFKGEPISEYIYSGSLENIAILISSLLVVVFFEPIIDWLIGPIKSIVNYFRLLKKEVVLVSDSASIDDKEFARVPTVGEVKDVFKEEISKPSDEDIVSVVGRNATSRWYSAVRRTIDSGLSHPITVYYPGPWVDITHPLITTDGDVFLFVDIGEGSSSIEKLISSISSKIIKLGGKIIEKRVTSDTEAVLDFEYGGRMRQLYYYNKVDASDSEVLPLEVKDGFDIYVEKGLRTGYTGSGIDKNLALPIALRYLHTGGFLLTDYYVKDYIIDSRLKTVGVEVKPYYDRAGVKYNPNYKKLSGEGLTHLTYFSELTSKVPQIELDRFAKPLFRVNQDGNVNLTQYAVYAINSLSQAYNDLTLEVDVETLIDTSKGIPQLKGLGFKETLASLYQAQENKQIPENFHVRLININPRLDREKIIKTLGLTDDLLKSFVAIPDIPQDYLIKTLEPYLIAGSIRVIFEDNVRYWGNKVDVLVKRGEETQTLSSLGLIVASLAKEPKFYNTLPKDIKEYIVAKTDEQGNIELDDEGKIKQLIFKPIEKTKVDTQYLERLNRANKELEGNV